MNLLAIWLAILGGKDFDFLNGLFDEVQNPFLSIVSDKMIYDDNNFTKLFLLDELQCSLGFPEELDETFTRARIELIWAQ
jgi:hypothetical protein